MKKLKIALSVIGIILCVLIVSSVTAIALAPASWDSGACGGGFTTYIIEKELDKIEEAVGMKLSEDQIASIKATLSFSGREMTAFCSGPSQPISITAKRYWIETYKWSVSPITCLLPIADDYT